MEIQGYSEAARWVDGQALEPDDWSDGGLISQHEIGEFDGGLTPPPWPEAPALMSDWVADVVALGEMIARAMIANLNRFDSRAFGAGPIDKRDSKRCPTPDQYVEYVRAQQDDQRSRRRRADHRTP